MPDMSDYMESLIELGAKPVDPRTTAEIKETQEKAINAILNDNECLNQARQMIATHARSLRLPSRREN